MAINHQAGGFPPAFLFSSGALNQLLNLGILDRFLDRALHDVAIFDSLTALRDRSACEATA
jgi:hypothetical protein